MTSTAPPPPHSVQSMPNFKHKKYVEHSVNDLCVKQQTIEHAKGHIQRRLIYRSRQLPVYRLNNILINMWTGGESTGRVDDGEFAGGGGAEERSFTGNVFIAIASYIF